MPDEPHNTDDTDYPVRVYRNDIEVWYGHYERVPAELAPWQSEIARRYLPAELPNVHDASDAVWETNPAVHATSVIIMDTEGNVVSEYHDDEWVVYPDEQSVEWDDKDTARRMDEIDAIIEEASHGS